MNVPYIGAQNYAKFSAWYGMFCISLNVELDQRCKKRKKKLLTWNNCLWKQSRCLSIQILVLVIYLGPLPAAKPIQVPNEYTNHPDKKPLIGNRHKSSPSKGAEERPEIKGPYRTHDHNQYS